MINTEATVMYQPVQEVSFLFGKLFMNEYFFEVGFSTAIVLGFGVVGD